MFREMRRAKQAISEKEIVDILEDQSHGILSVLGDDDYAYGVPLNYVYSNHKLYMHCAKSGHKLDAIQKNPKVSFCVVSKDEILPEHFTSNFESVVVFGQVSIVEDETIFMEAMNLMVLKYSEQFQDMGAIEIQQSKNFMYVLQIDIEHMSGKRSKYGM